MDNSKDYLKKTNYNYIQVSAEFNHILVRWIETQRLKMALYNGGISPEERVRIENDVKNGESLLITGIYSWGRIFGTDYNRTWLYPGQVKDYSQYDIVHVNLYGLTESKTTDIREKIGWNTKTKIVANLDYSVELLPRCKDFEKPYRIARDLNNADMIFATEEHQRDILEHILKRKVHLIPHPTATHELKAVSRPIEERLTRNIHDRPVLLINLHRWDMNSTYPFLAFKPTTTDELDYEDYVANIDTRGNITGSQDEHNRMKILYTNILEPLPYTKFMDFCSMTYAAMDIYTMYSYGRFILDMGCLGVPTVGSDRCASQLRIWPELATNPYDLKKQYDLLKKLRYDADFYKEMIEKGKERVEFYSYERSRKRFLDALYGEGVVD